jgi:hypothetical protein
VSSRKKNTLLDDVALPLKRKLAAGDRSASAQLDEIDRKRRENARREEGLRAALAEVDGRIQPIKQQTAELRRAATAAKNEAEFQKWCNALVADRELFREQVIVRGCRVLGKIRVDANEGVRRWGNKALQAFERLISTPMTNPLNDLHQQGWREPNVTIYGLKVFTIRGMVPPVDHHTNGNGKPKS